VQRAQPGLQVRAGCRRDQVEPRLAQHADHRQVRRGHRVAQQAVRFDPGHGLALAAARRALPARDPEHLQPQPLARVVLGHLDQAFADLDLDSQFLLQLARQRGLRALARLPLAAGKFPEPRQVAVLAALGEQDAAADVGDDAGHDVDRSQRCFHGGSLTGHGRGWYRLKAPVASRLFRSPETRTPPCGGVLDRRRGRMPAWAQPSWPWQCLYFLPLPQGQGSLRPTFGSSRTTLCTGPAGVWAPVMPATSSSVPYPPLSACWNCAARNLASAWARSWASSAATSSSLRMRTRASRLITWRLTLSSISENSSKASFLYSCFGCFCA